MPVGEGMGATQEAWALMSPTRAAGNPAINTVGDPMEITPGPAGTQPGRTHGVVISETRAAGAPPTITVGAPLMMVSGRAGCGNGVGVGAGGWIGA